MTPVIAVKCYGYAWMTELGLDERAAAALMAAHGVDLAMVQNTLDPLPESDVAQRRPDGYDQERFRDELRAHGIKIFESTAVFHQPDRVESEPDLRPVGDDGRPMARFDWYLGVSPHSAGYLARRVELMADVVDKLRPDGVFLSFIRFPGFWEGWTPQVPPAHIRDFGFAPGSVARFARDTGIELPPKLDARAAARLILTELAPQWTAWKCGVISDAVRRLAGAAQAVQPGTATLINGVAFPRADRGDLGRRILGQDLGELSTLAEYIETMVYHQILARDAMTWIPEVVADLRPVVRSTLLPSVQTSPAYTRPPHDGMGRAEELTPPQVVEALRAVARTAADGVTVYHWTDVAREDLHGDGLIARALRDYKEGAW